MEHPQVTGPYSSPRLLRLRIFAMMAFALLVGVIYVLCSATLVCLFSFGFPLLRLFWRLVLSPWVDRSFILGLTFGFFGGSLVSRALYTPDVGLAFGFLGGSLISGALYTPDLCYAVSAILLSIAIWCSGSTVGTSLQPCDILDVGSTRAKQDVIPVMLPQVTPNPLIPLVTNVVVCVAVDPRPARLFYLSHLDMCWLVLPFLDSFEAVLTTSGFYNFRHHTPQISEWYRGYVKSFVGFVPDIGTIVVRTSAGTVVYPEADNIMRATNLVHLKKTKTSESRSSVITLQPMRKTTGAGAFLDCLLDCLRHSIMWGFQCVKFSETFLELHNSFASIEST